MSKRHNDALAIAAGACNPTAIAVSILDACREIPNEPAFMGTRSITRDPAIKLMVHQLAYICGIMNGVEEFNLAPKYDECTKVCEEKKS